MLQGLIDRTQGRTPWRRLGIIHLGYNVGTAEKPRPKDADHFVLDLTTNPELAVLGAKPREIEILLMSPTLEHVLHTEAAIYQSNKTRKCWTDDDKTAHRFMDVNKDVEGKPEDFKWVTMDCPNQECEFRKPQANGKQPPCKERAYLKFAIPATLGQPGPGGKPVELGEYHMKVGSRVSMDQMYTTLNLIQNLCAAQQRPNGIAGLRMRLVRREVKLTQPMPDKERGGMVLAKITKWIPMLEPDWNRLLESDKKLLGPIFERPALLEAVPLADAEDAEVGEEAPPTRFATEEGGDAPAGLGTVENWD